MPVNDKWKAVVKATRQQLLHDPDLHKFLESIFPQEKERFKYIKKAHRKLKTQRMLNHAHWYLTMADEQEKVAPGKPALKLIFLMALAEYITKTGDNNTNISSSKAIYEFFRYISPEDKAFLKSSIKRGLVSYKNKELRFSSLIQILYNVRNKAVHGEDYYSFSMPSQEHRLNATVEYTHWSYLTSGTLKSKPRKQGRKRKTSRVFLDIGITYEELREIFRRTAIANITGRF